ncbi:MAG TPA: SRPBCC family protein [Mycobacteriales bacterium]|nr:SRPBCC family protein [Mycobacteriales bacterium]
MRQELTTDTVDRYIEAPPETLYDIVSDVTRTPEMSPEIEKCTWIKGATGPVVGARFRAINRAGRGHWPNWPVVIAADPGREFAFARTEPFGGTVEWRYRFVPEGSGTRVHESYEVTKPIGLVGWFIISTLGGLKDRRADLRAGMTQTLDRLADISEAKPQQS